MKTCYHFFCAKGFALAPLPGLFCCLGLLFLLLFSPSGRGQCPPFQEGFEATGCPISPCPHIDNNNCLPGWATSHGGPHTSTDAAAQGGRSLRIDWDYFPHRTQGAFLGQTFTAGQAYLLTFDMAVGGFDNDAEEGFLNVALANGLAHNGNCANNAPPLVSGAQAVHSEPVEFSSPNIGPWEARSIPVCPQGSGFAQLWFYTTLTSNPDGEPGGRAYIDNLKIQRFDAGFDVVQSPSFCLGAQFNSACAAGDHHWDFGDGAITVEMPYLEGEADAAIKDIHGRVVWEGRITGSTLINVSTLPNGMYFLSVARQDTPAETIRFVRM